MFERSVSTAPGFSAAASPRLGTAWVPGTSGGHGLSTGRGISMETLTALMAATAGIPGCRPEFVGRLRG